MKNNKDNFVHLHCHDSYSYTDGFGLPNKWIEKAKELGQPAIAITNHGGVSSHYKWYKAAIKSEIKPILGCEMYMIDNYNNKDPENKYNHIVVLSLNNTGYKNLLKLVTKSWLEGFYYKPRITYEDLALNQEGLLFTTGCPAGKIGQLVKNGKITTAETELKLMAKTFKNFYIEISPWTYDEGKKYFKFLLKMHQKTKIPLIATNDCHYIEKYQNEIQEIMLCIQSGDKMDNPNRWKFNQQDFYLKSRKEMEESLKAIEPNFDYTKALDNTVDIASMIDFKFPIATPMKFPMLGKEKVDYFKKLVKEGFKKREYKTNQKDYVKRTKYEVDLIIKKDFIDYFLIVADLVNWAKNHNILVGPARGSAAGSLVCYLIGITEVDPIIHNLLFERFIDINREDIPDIDIDFEDSKRHLVKEYLIKKYGSDKVGDLATFGTFKGKMCISDIARVFKIPFSISDKLKSLIIERSGGDSRASFTIEDTFNNPEFAFPKQAIAQYPALKYAAQMEGQVRHLSKHAAGIVISNEPITNFCAIYKSGNETVLSLDGNDIKDIGLLKIDILGINTLTAIQKAIDLIKNRQNKTIDLYHLSLDDKKVFKNFQDKNKLFGIFQFEGQSVNQVCRQIKPNNFVELSDISALSRPGPLHSGSTTLYINRKFGKQNIEKIHSLMKDITKDTWGIIIYQEQVMRTMREIGLMSWKDTAEIRMNISRSRGIEAFNKYKEIFSIGAKKRGLSEKEIDNIWATMCTFGSWAFNKSHSVSYTIISYWCVASGQKVFDPYKSKWTPISKAYKNKLNKTLCLKENGNIEISPIKNILRTGKKEVYRVSTNFRNQSITASKEHLLWTKKGWKKIEELKIGDFILLSKRRQGKNLGVKISKSLKNKWKSINKIEKENWLKGLRKLFKNKKQLIKRAKNSYKSKIKNRNDYKNNPKLHH